MTDKLTLASDKPHDQQAAASSEADHSEDRMRRALEQLGGSSPGRTHHAPPSAHETFATTRKHRFVQDGDVQVTHVQGRRDRGARSASPTPFAAPEAKLNDAQDALAEERGLRQRAERAAQDAQALIATLQTKLGHSEIALSEARDTMQAHAEATSKLQSELQSHDEQIKSLQIQLAAIGAERDRLGQDLAQVVGAQQNAARQTTQAFEMPPIKAPAGKAPAAKAAVLNGTPTRKISRLTRSVAQIQKARDPNAEEPQPVKWWLGNKE
jgi:hypothetical protein